MRSTAFQRTTGFVQTFYGNWYLYCRGTCMVFNFALNPHIFYRFLELVPGNRVHALEILDLEDYRTCCDPNLYFRRCTVLPLYRLVQDGVRGGMSYRGGIVLSGTIPLCIRRNLIVPAVPRSCAILRNSRGLYISASSLIQVQAGWPGCRSGGLALCSSLL